MSQTDTQSQPPPSDEELLLLYRQGQDWAFGALVERYQQELFHFLIRFTGSRAAAEDMFQEAFLQVHISADTFDIDKRFKPWLFTIAANKARDHLRRSVRRKTVALSAPVAGDDSNQSFADLLQADLDLPPELLQQQETRELVQQVVADMPDHLREILILSYFHQFPYKEIAEVLGIPLGTVKSRLHAAVATFAQRWKHARKADASPGEA